MWFHIQGVKTFFTFCVSRLHLLSLHRSYFWYFVLYVWLSVGERPSLRSDYTYTLKNVL